jgi:copper(I)-binding protein
MHRPYNAGMNRSSLRAAAVAVLLVPAACSADPDAARQAAGTACLPTLVAPWVRAAPPGTMMLAGYAVVRNDCAAAVTIVGAESLDFASASMHETVVEQGVSRMRATGPLVVPAHAQVAFAPGGRHLMLMGPARALPEGATARIRLVLADGRRVFAEFSVRRDAPH